MEIVQLSAASIGEVDSSMSCPYKHNPASSLKLSLAPKPAGRTVWFDEVINKSANAAALSFGTEISNPSSPVYPQRVTVISVLFKAFRVVWRPYMNFKSFNYTWGINLWRDSAALGPWRAINACSVRCNNSTSFPSYLNSSK